jgi:hypothetical protein
MARIFISYASPDAAFADQYYQALVERAHAVWMDRAELKGGHEWVHIIQERIRWSDTMIVLWSAHALASTWVEMEMTYAHTLRKKIIPVLIDDTSPQTHMIVNSRQVIDARQTGLQSVISQIEESIERDNRRPITTRAEPVQIDTPPPARTPTRPNLRLIAGVVVMLLVVSAGLVLAITSGNPSQLAITPPAITATTHLTPSTPASELPANALDQPASLELLNTWRAANNLPVLIENPALQTVAEQHVSYLRSLPLSELESINLFRNADGQDVVFMANEAGYNGEVMMLVATTDGDYNLQNLLNELDQQVNFTEAGHSQVRSIATNKLYFVLILGAGT